VPHHTTKRQRYTTRWRLVYLAILAILATIHRYTERATGNEQPTQDTSLHLLAMQVFLLGGAALVEYAYKILFRTPK